MITRFRLEARANTSEECFYELANMAEMIMRNSEVNRGLWKCTDEVIERSGTSYRGRVVWKAELYPQPIPNRSHRISQADWDESRGE